MTKQFLVQVQMGDKTCEVSTDAALISEIKATVTMVATNHTEGPVPLVRVVQFTDVEDGGKTASLLKDGHYFSFRAK